MLYHNAGNHCFSIWESNTITKGAGQNVEFITWQRITVFSI